MDNQTPLQVYKPAFFTLASEDNILIRSVPLGDYCFSSYIPLPADTFLKEPCDLSSNHWQGYWWKECLRGVTPHPIEPPSPYNRPALGSIHVADLFCGIGGFANGVKQFCVEAGLLFNSLMAVDIDQAATEVYTQNHQTQLPLVESVKSLVDYRIRSHGSDASFSYAPELADASLAKALDGIDLVLAGPPCQGSSNLNNHKHHPDNRNLYYLTVPAFAVACRARAVIIENVPAVVHNAEPVVETAIALFAASGYETVQGVLKADAMGWPQTRKRHFLIARPRDVGGPISLDKISEILAKDPLPLSWALGEHEELSSDEALHKKTQATEKNQARIEWLFKHDAHNLVNSERPDCHQSGTTYSASYGRMHYDRPAPTITTGFISPGRGRFVHPTQPRTITPAEAARLQGFPDNYCYRTDPNIEPGRTALAKWIGDAVALPLGYAAALSALGPDLVQRTS